MQPEQPKQQAQPQPGDCPIRPDRVDLDGVALPA